MGTGSTRRILPEGAALTGSQAPGAGGQEGRGIQLHLIPAPGGPGASRGPQPPLRPASGGYRGLPGSTAPPEPGTWGDRVGRGTQLPLSPAPGGVGGASPQVHTPESQHSSPAPETSWKVRGRARCGPSSAGNSRGGEGFTVYRTGGSPSYFFPFSQYNSLLYQTKNFQYFFLFPP